MIQTSPGYYVNGLISGSGTLKYPISGGYVWNMFNTASTYWQDGITPATTNGNFTIGVAGVSFPSYSISETGLYQFRAYFDISSIVSTINDSASYKFTMEKNSIDIYSNTQTHYGYTNLWNYIPYGISSDVISLIPSDIVTFKLQITSSANFTASLSSGSIYILPSFTSNTEFIIDNTITPFISGSTEDNGNGVNNVFILSPDVTYIMNSLFNPSYSSGSILSSSLYNKYGDVSYPFTLNNDTIILFKALSPSGLNSYEYRIRRINQIDGKYYLYLNKTLPSFLSIPTYSNTTFEEVVFLKEIPDETMVLLNFKRTEGKTSYGLFIPENLHPDVLDQINIITQGIKTKLIEINN